MDDNASSKRPRRNKTNKVLKERRSELKRKPTPTERRVWNYLRNRRFYGYLWKRQYNINNCFLDFYCPEAKFGLELNGLIHDDPERHKRDLEKTRRLEEMDIKVMHIRNPRIYYEWDRVAMKILMELQERCPKPKQNNTTSEA